MKYQSKIREDLKVKLFQNSQKPKNSEISEFRIQKLTETDSLSSESLEDVNKDTTKCSFDKKYTILNELGQGCHASVYKAVHNQSQCYYAVKIEKTGDPEILQNHIRTFKNCQRLKHPNLLKYYEMFIDENKEKVYNVMEYSAHQTLEKQINKLNQVEFRQILLQILSTLDYCHKNHICHRDIKPDNLLVNKKENKIDLKIIDFDVSKDFKIREMWTCVGCVYYCAPEMFSGCGYTHLIDLWSVGVILYQFLFKKLPFSLETISETIESIMNEEIQFPEDSQIGTIEKDLLKRLLNKNASNRISAEEALKHPYFYEDKTSETKSDYGFSFDEASSLTHSQNQQNLSSKFIEYNDEKQIKGFNENNEKKIHITKKPFFDLSKIKILKFRDASFTPNPQIFNRKE